jgi:hypothetical protein
LAALSPQALPAKEGPISSNGFLAFLGFFLPAGADVIITILPIIMVAFHHLRILHNTRIMEGF